MEELSVVFLSFLIWLVITGFKNIKQKINDVKIDLGYIIDTIEFKKRK